MKTFDYVEDYLEVIAGYREIDGSKNTTMWFSGFNPIINLARYDVGVLDSMSDSAMNGQALTEKQGELAVKILLKYQRQLFSKGVDVGPLTKPEWRLPLRKMDYSRTLSLRDELIVVKFPFNNELIDSVREFAKESQGLCSWNRDRRAWEVALTEYHVMWLHTWAELNQFNIDPELTRLYRLIEEESRRSYAIELIITDTGLDITNCPDTLRAYIESTLGGFGVENLLKLVDASAEMGYTISKEISETLIKEFGFRFQSLASNREIKVNPADLFSNDDLGEIFNYANVMGRYPVYVYEPDLSDRILLAIKHKFKNDEVIVVNKIDDLVITEQTKVVYTRKIFKPMAEEKPLLISTAGMLFGGDKQFLIQTANKVVYCAAEVYNKRNASKINY